MTRNKAFWPAKLERNLLIFEMTLAGFSDKDIATAMGVEAQSLTGIRRKLYDLMMVPERMRNRAPEQVGHITGSLRKYASFWHGRLFALKVEFGILNENTGTVCVA